jgi:transposase-like protein
MIERLNREIKRRTRVAPLFPNQASLLRLVSAILMETSEAWKQIESILRCNMACSQIEFTEKRLHNPKPLYVIAFLVDGIPVSAVI